MVKGYGKMSISLEDDKQFGFCFNLMSWQIIFYWFGLCWGYVWIYWFFLL